MKASDTVYAEQGRSLILLQQGAQNCDHFII